MPKYILHHRHDPDECAAAFAAWIGFESPLRHAAAWSTCLAGGHSLIVRVEAPASRDAIAMLPAFVAARTEALEVRAVQLP